MSSVPIRRLLVIIGVAVLAALMLRDEAARLAGTDPAHGSDGISSERWGDGKHESSTAIGLTEHCLTRRATGLRVRSATPA